MSPEPRPSSSASERATSSAGARTVRIADRPRNQLPRRAAPEFGLPPLLAWCLPLVFLVAIVFGARIVLANPPGLFGWAFGGLAGAGMLWIVVSTFFPAKADRTCPACGKTALRRLDPRTTTGLLCGRCGWRDETSSSFLLAEAEGPLEDIVAAQRAPGSVPEQRDRGSA